MDRLLQMKKISKLEDGFSAVELLVTLFIAAAFVIAFNQLYLVITQTNAATKLQATASDIAYSNLRKYTTKPPFDCPNNNLTINNLAPGAELSKTTISVLPSPLPVPYIQTVLAFGPRGCADQDPVLIKSIVEYGSPVKKVEHATYVN